MTLDEIEFAIFYAPGCDLCGQPDPGARSFVASLNKNALTDVFRRL